MKPYLLLFAVLFCFSCSEDDEIVEETEFREYIVSTKNACDFRDSTENNEYCITEEMYDYISERMVEEYADGGCGEITFEDIQGNEISAIINSLGSSTVTESTSNCQ